MNAHISMCWVAVVYPSNYTPALWVKKMKVFQLPAELYCVAADVLLYCFPLATSGHETQTVAWEAAVVIPQNRPCGSEKRLEMVSMATEEQPLEKEM